MRAGDRQTVVLGEIARLGARVTERLLDMARGVFGDVLVEGARHRTRGEDTLDGAMLEGAEGGGVAKCRVDIVGAKALPQEQDLTGLTAPNAGSAEAHQAEEGGGALAHALEGDLDLVQVDGAPAVGRRMELGGIELETLTAWSELVACDALQVGRIDEELALGHAHRQQIGDVIVRNGVPIALPVDETVDAADAVHDTGGVVGVPRQ